MPLKFPNARLLIYDLLNSSGLTGPQAIVQGAVDVGLIDKEAANELTSKNGSSSCHCLAMTREILNKYCRDKNNQANGPPIDSEKVWSSLHADLKTYRNNVAEHHKHCQRDNNGDCVIFAPALFDLLLQQINRYS